MSARNLLQKQFGELTPDFVFKQEWVAYLEQNVPLYSRLPEELREILHQRIGQFVSNTFFEGCNGLELSDEIVLSISAQACILTLKQDSNSYSLLKTVLVYPSAFDSTTESAGPGSTIIERKVQCVGESWENGTVILAWDAVRQGATNIFDGHNVTFHEFAHQLDALDGDTDGVPILASGAAFQTWAHVLSVNCERLIEAIQSGKQTILDPYAATSPGEYFAVATETFFEKPLLLEKEQPELYAELKGFYGLNPADWFR